MVNAGQRNPHPGSEFIGSGRASHGAGGGAAVAARNYNYLTGMSIPGQSPNDPTQPATHPVVITSINPPTIGGYPPNDSFNFDFYGTGFTALIEDGLPDGDSLWWQSAVPGVPPDPWVKDGAVFIDSTHISWGKREDWPTGTIISFYYQAKAGNVSNTITATIT